MVLSVKYLFGMSSRTKGQDNKEISDFYKTVAECLRKLTRD